MSPSVILNNVLIWLLLDFSVSGIISWLLTLEGENLAFFSFLSYVPPSPSNPHPPYLLLLCQDDFIWGRPMSSQHNALVNAVRSRHEVY